MLKQWGCAATVLLLLTASFGAAAQAPAQPQRFATVHKITGVVQASDPVSGKARTIRQGDVLYVGEQIRSSGTGEAVLRTDDAGVIAVRPNAQFVVDQFKAEGKADDQFSVRILSGALRMITGWVGVLNKSGNRIATPTATIGIRGTDHEPYVLPHELARQLRQPAGTYNKVNRGGTYLDTGGAQVDIDAGRVGFAPAAPEKRYRALMTALLPALLEKVPGFFVPGAFDAELEGLAAMDLSEAMRVRQLTPPLPAPVTAATVQPTGSESSTTKAGTAIALAKSNDQPAVPGACDAQAIAVQWLAELDAALVARDAAKFVAQFAPDVSVRARVKGVNGAVSELKFTRSELAKSTFASLAQLSEFSSRRPVVLGKLANRARSVACERIEIESVVIESGVRSGGAYRLESLETFTLEQQGGRWVATQALTTQN